MKDKGKFLQIGANRGGTFQCLSLAQARPRVPVEMEIVDPEPYRAQGLASLYQGYGIPARAFEMRGEDYLTKNRNGSARILSVDDPRTLAYGLQHHQDFTAFGFLCANGEDIGSHVIGIGGILTKKDLNYRHAKTLTQAFSRMIPTPTSSALMRRPMFNTFQMSFTRERLYQELTSQIIGFLHGEDLPSTLFVTHAMYHRHVCYPVTSVVPIQRTVRTKLRALAIDMAWQNETEESRKAVCFIQQETPVLYVAMLQKNSNKWDVEFMPDFGRPQPQEVERPRIMLTD